MQKNLSEDFEGLQFIRYDIFGRHISTTATKNLSEIIEMHRDNKVNENIEEEDSSQELPKYNKDLNLMHYAEDSDEEEEQILNNKENMLPLTAQLQTPQRPPRNTNNQMHSNYRSPLLDITPPLPHTKKKNQSGFMEVTRYYSIPTSASPIAIYVQEPVVAPSAHSARGDFEGIAAPEWSLYRIRSI